MPLSAQTRQTVRDYLLAQVERYIVENLPLAEEKALRQPFHAALMPIPFAAWSALSERSFSTRSGSWFKKIAVDVARQFHAAAQPEYEVAGHLQPAVEAHITTLIDQMDHGTPRRLPNRAQDQASVLAVQSPGGVPRAHRSDLYVRCQDGRELYFEMKTPWPNKDTSKAMKEGILKITALRKGFSAHAFAACAYNPYNTTGDGEPFTPQYAGQFLELGEDIVAGRAFWGLIGDADTYDELLAISEAIGTELSPLIEQAGD